MWWSVILGLIACGAEAVQTDCAKVLCGTGEYCLYPAEGETGETGDTDSASPVGPLPVCTTAPAACADTPTCDCLTCSSCDDADGLARCHP